MSKKYFLITTAIICGLYVTLMSVFTFYDYTVTNYLFNRGTAFGKICESVGPMFMPFFIIYSVIGLFFFSNFKKKVSKIFAYFGLGFTLVYALFMGTMTHKHSYAYWMFIPSIVLYLAFIAFTVLLNKRIKKKDRSFCSLHLKIVLIMFITACVSLIGVDIIKSVFGRVRYINLTDPSLFRPWYCFNKFDFNSSFPSGHAARSMTTLCFALIPLYFNRKKLFYVLEIVAVLFAFTVSVTRLFEGMHYPTDILTGCFLSFICFYISKYHFLDR